MPKGDNNKNKNKMVVNLDPERRPQQELQQMEVNLDLKETISRTRTKWWLTWILKGDY